MEKVYCKKCGYKMVESKNTETIHCMACGNKEKRRKIMGKTNRKDAEFETISKVGCVEYLKSWVEDLNEKIAKGDPNALLYNEQVAFLNKAIVELEKTK